MTVFDPADPPANLWPEWPETGIARLRWWQHRRREQEAREREWETVEAALRRAEEERAGASFLSGA